MAINLPQNLNIGMPPQMKSSRNFLLEIVLLVVVCVLFSWFIVMPKNAEVDAENTTLAAVASKEKTTAQSLQTINQLVLQLKGDTAQVAELDNALPLSNTPDNPQLLIESLANASGVTLGDVSLADDSNPNAVVAGDKDLISNPFGATRSLQKISGTVYVIGTFPQVEDFLKKIETSGRLMDVSSVEIGGSQDNNLNLKIGLDAYYLAP